MARATRRFALWQADLDGGVCAAPEECVEALRDRERITLVLEHRDHGRTPTRQIFDSALTQKVRADTRTPAPKPITTATTRRGGEVNRPRTTPTTKLELASDPYSRAVPTDSLLNRHTQTRRGGSARRITPAGSEHMIECL